MQRDVGIDLASGDPVVRFDDEPRPAPDDPEGAIGVVDRSRSGPVGDVADYRPNIRIPAERGGRWRSYRTLHLPLTFRPSFYDWKCGYPDVAGSLTFAQQARFWRFQVFEFFRLSASAVRRSRREDLENVQGRLEGIRAEADGTYRAPRA